MAKIIGDVSKVMFIMRTFVTFFCITHLLLFNYISFRQVPKQMPLSFLLHSPLESSRTKLYCASHCPRPRPPLVNLTHNTRSVKQVYVKLELGRGVFLLFDKNITIHLHFSTTSCTEQNRTISNTDRMGVCEFICTGIRLPIH